MPRSDGLQVLGKRVAKHSSRDKPHRCKSPLRLSLVAFSAWFGHIGALVSTVSSSGTGAGSAGDNSWLDRARGKDAIIRDIDDRAF